MTERRKDKRYVVEGLTAAVDGSPADILDISASSVRLCVGANSCVPEEAELSFSTEHPFWIGSYQTTGKMLRKDLVSCVFTYVRPCPDWDQLIADHNSFRANLLKEQIGV